MGTLHIVATPIGHLEDVTFRALRVLREADWVLAEDTRRTRVLLDHFDIPQKPTSLHAHNEAGRIDSILEALNEGKQVALVSDAGTPLVSDPGERLVVNGYVCSRWVNSKVRAPKKSKLKPLHEARCSKRAFRHLLAIVRAPPHRREAVARH